MKFFTREEIEAALPERLRIRRDRGRGQFNPKRQDRHSKIGARARRQAQAANYEIDRRRQEIAERRYVQNIRQLGGADSNSLIVRPGSDHLFLPGDSQGRKIITLKTGGCNEK